MTPWGDELNSDAPLPEYPRPQLRRDSYLNLNGRWEYAFRINDRTPAAYDGEIVVPFSPEAQLSGVGRQLRPGEFLHYRRNFAVPDGFLRDRVLLHFGAVDQNCTALVNGKTVGTHTGGYLPFTFDVTDVLQPVNELQVVVTDPSDTEPGSRGKQVLKPGGIWYTAQSGIWQTVWLESVPQVHVRDLRIEPALDHVQITVETSAPADCVVEMAGQSVATRSGRPVRIDIPDPQLWTPENPYLYDIRVSAGDDQVSSYAGLRTTEVRGGQLLLNGQPYFHTGVLDQGYWPDGLYTPPSDDAMVFDITTAKDLGFTMLRKHIKVEPCAGTTTATGSGCWSGRTWSTAVIPIGAGCSSLRPSHRFDSRTATTRGSVAPMPRPAPRGWTRCRRRSRYCTRAPAWSYGCRSTRAGASSTRAP